LGAPGRRSGIAEGRRTDSGPVPAAFCAATATKYVVPFASPGIVHASVSVLVHEATGVVEVVLVYACAV
jgi:hypothetical protein